MSSAICFYTVLGTADVSVNNLDVYKESKVLDMVS